MCVFCACCTRQHCIIYSYYKGRLPVDAVEHDHTVVGDGVLESTDVADDGDCVYLV